MVILPSTNKTQAQNYVNRAKHKLANEPEPLSSEGTSFHLKFSHGLASVFEERMDSLAILLNVADKRLNKAK